MIKSCIPFVLLASQVGAALAFSFSSKIGSRPTHINLPTTPPKRTLDSSLFLSPPSNEGATAQNAVQKRRSFLANFAATSLLPLLSLANPASASAFGFKIDDKGPLVYGADDIMSPKEHGTTAMPVQENLRYGVSSDVILLI